MEDKVYLDTSPGSNQTIVIEGREFVVRSVRTMKEPHAQLYCVDIELQEKFELKSPRQSSLRSTVNIKLGGNNEG